MVGSHYGRFSIGLRICLFVSILVAAACLFSPTASASTDDMVLGYVSAMGGTGSQDAFSIDVDAAGNTYIAGSLYETADFDPGPGVYEITSVGSRDIYVCKLDSSGALVWARSAGGVSYDLASGIAVDEAGNVYATGLFRGTADFDPGPGTFNLVGPGLENIFIWKLDSSGNLVWAKSMGASGRDRGFDVAADSAGNVYCTGMFDGAVDLDPGPGVFTVTSAGATDSFTCKLDALGNLLWAISTGADSSDCGYRLELDGAGNVYSTGWFGSTVDLDPGAGVFNLTSAGGTDIYVRKLNASGEFQWARGMGGDRYDSGLGFALDGIGNVYCVGTFEGSGDFDPGAEVFMLSSGGFEDVFICTLDPGGDFLWAGSIGGPGSETGYGVGTDATGNIYFTGGFEGPTDFDPGPDVVNLNSPLSWDIFVCKLSPSGGLQWVGGMGGDNGDEGRDIAVDGAGQVSVAGYFRTMADFDPSSNDYVVASGGASDAFSLKLEPQLLPMAGDDYAETDADLILTALSVPATTSVLSNDSDANTLASLTVTAHDATSILGAAISVNPDGTFLYNPMGASALQALAAGESLVDSFTYTVSDATDTALGKVVITVYGKGQGLPATNGWGLWALTMVLLLLGTGALQFSRARILH